MSEKIRRQRKRVNITLTDKNQEEMRINTRQSYLKFLMLGAFGLQNILRTTEYVITYGGGLFTYPFIVSCFFISLPIYYSEIFLAQYTRKSVLSLWEMAPISCGFFYYIFTVAAVAGIFKSMHVAYSWYYFFHTFSPNMTNTECPPNDSTCLDPTMFGKLDPECALNVIHVHCPNATLQFPLVTFVWDILQPPTHHVVNTRLLASLVFTWAVIFIMLFLSIYKLKRFFQGVILFSSIFTAMLLIVIYAHDGSEEGLKFIFSMQETKTSFYEILFWAIYHSFEVTPLTNPVNYSFPSRITFISNPAVDSLYVTLLSTTTALLFAYLNFAVFGIISKQAGIKIDTLHVPAAEAIIVSVIPNFLAHLPACRLWLLGYNFVLLALLILNLAGFRIIQPLYQIRYQQSVLLVALLLETATIYWLYGTSVLFVDIQFMKKSPPKLLWKVWWNITPIIIMGLIYYHTSYFLTYLNQKLSNHQIRITNVMSTLIMMIIPIGSLVKAVEYIRKEKMDSLLKPEFTWGPPNPYLRALRKKYNPSEEIRSQPFTYHQWRLELSADERTLHDNPEDT